MEDARPSLAAQRVLIVDDQAFVRTALRGILAKAGIENITEAAGGREAIAYLSAPDQFYDIIFCDLQMPGVDGIETLRAIAELGTTAALVLMSSEELEILEAAEYLARSYGLATLGYIGKPITAERVYHLLRTKLQTRAAKTKAQQRTHLTDAELRAGLRSDEIYVLFQPKVSLRSRELAGVEALVRWRHPRLGNIGPAEFIPIAEQTDTIDLLTLHVLEKALAAQAQWRAAGRDIKVAINVSTRSMTRLDLPDRLAREVLAANARPSGIVLEITESRVADNIATLLDICARLRLKGFQLSIDDFGTGFSTLEQLARLPFSELKVDQSFVTGTSNDPRKRAILEASLALARKLGLRSVCEGVETEREWQVVHALGADFAQGYLMAKPLPADELASWRYDAVQLH